MSPSFQSKPSGKPSLLATEVPSTSFSPTQSSSLSKFPSVSAAPTLMSSSDPVNQPTTNPSKALTTVPADQPSAYPTRNPTDHPTVTPTGHPTDVPTEITSSPTYPTGKPSLPPTVLQNPTASPFKSPTAIPTTFPTISQRPSIDFRDKPKIAVTFPASLYLLVQDSLAVTTELVTTGDTKTALRNTIKVVTQQPLSGQQRVKQVNILGTGQMQTYLVLLYELVLEELCLVDCEEQTDSTTMYNDVTSHIVDSISNGGLTTILQANAADCADECTEIQNAFAMGGVFGDYEIVVVTPDPVLTSTPTPKPTKRGKGQKSQKDPTQEPTPYPTRRPKGGKGRKTNSPSRPPTPKPTKRAKSKTHKKQERDYFCRGRRCNRNRVRPTSLVATDYFLPTETMSSPQGPPTKGHGGFRAPSPSSFFLTLKSPSDSSVPNDYHPMRKRTPIKTPINLSHKKTLPDDFSHNFNAEQYDSRRGRIRDHASGTSSLQLLSSPEHQKVYQKHMRERNPTLEEDLNWVSVDRQTEKEGDYVSTGEMPN